MDPSRVAEDLIVKWINGQKAHVVSVLGELTPLQAACVGAMMGVELANDPSVGADSFIAHMELLL